MKKYQNCQEQTTGKKARKYLDETEVLPLFFLQYPEKTLSFHYLEKDTSELRYSFYNHYSRKLAEMNKSQKCLACVAHPVSNFI